MDQRPRLGWWEHPFLALFLAALGLIGISVAKVARLPEFSWPNCSEGVLGALCLVAFFLASWSRVRIVVLWCGIVLGLLCGLLELPNVVLTALPVDNAPNSRLFGDGAWLLAVFLVSYTGVWLMRDHRSRYHEAMRRTAPKPKENGEKSADQPAEGKQVGSEAFDTEIRTLPSRAPDRVTLLHLSDLHFLSTYQVEGRKEPPELGHLMAQLSLLKGKVDIIAVTGDLVDGEIRTAKSADALKSAMRYLREITSVLGLTEKALLIIPGNHDYRRLGLFASPEMVLCFQKECGQYGQHSLFSFPESDLNLFFACFDSNVGLSPFELSTGYVDIHSVEQVETWVKGLKGDAKDFMDSAFRVALVHHHILPVADAEELLTRKERRRLRKLLGAPELMILKNAAIFLRKLQRLRIRLVLHGHLHVRSCLQTVAHASANEPPRTMEIVAAGSACLPEQGTRFTFNVVEIFKGHTVQVTPYDFTSGGVLIDDTVLPRTLSYDAVRTECFDQRPFADRQKIRCETYLCSWDIYLPTCDVTVVQVLKGLESETPDTPPDFVLEMREPSLTAVEFEARNLRKRDDQPEPKVDPITEEQLKAAGLWSEADNEKFGVPMRYRVYFEEPLPVGKKVDVVCSWKCKGLQYRSKEDKIHWGSPKGSLETDQAAHLIRWPCERFVVNVRFHCGPVINFWPVQVHRRVRDRARNWVVAERDSGHVSGDYSYPGDDKDIVRAKGDVIWDPYAYLSVYRPQIGFEYSLVWELPDFDIADDGARDTVTKMRSQLLEFRLEPQRRTILQDWLRKIRDELAARFQARLTAYLFGFDESQRRLECVASTEAEKDPLAQSQIPWGTDIIGLAFRRNEAFSFSRRFFDRNKKKTQRFKKMPTQVESLAALPIENTHWRIGSEGIPQPTWPIGIVAIASFEKRSGLETEITRGGQSMIDLGKEVSNRFLDEWPKFCIRLDSR